METKSFAHRTLLAPLSRINVAPMDDREKRQ